MRRQRAVCVSVRNFGSSSLLVSCRADRALGSRASSTDVRPGACARRLTARRVGGSKGSRGLAACPKHGSVQVASLFGAGLRSRECWPGGSTFSCVLLFHSPRESA